MTYVNVNEKIRFDLLMLLPVDSTRMFIDKKTTKSFENELSKMSDHKWRLDQCKKLRNEKKMKMKNWTEQSIVENSSEISFLEILWLKKMLETKERWNLKLEQ